MGKTGMKYELQWRCQESEVGGKVEGIWGMEVRSGVQGGTPVEVCEQKT